ncbi:DUF2929 family protein [Gemella sp. zg-570]|uniref:DUF2929 family protein n=1 Tax=unclassified Gemella TaxID=2624949 RepID=UPI001C0425CD|nr:DUF2929 family protein [Gemella sp. zg-570]MBU0278039.1 DUF2929 family protein [Gemella sp. zg-1178]QWQ38432.1 DUF2929 family protein [Gemella sp. zg-570]
MKFLISLFWGFIFAFIAIFIVSSILGSNGVSQGLTIQNCAILALVFAIGAAGLDSLIKVNKK